MQGNRTGNDSGYGSGHYIMLEPLNGGQKQFCDYRYMIGYSLQKAEDR